MQLEHVSCRNFRSLTGVSFTPAPGINVLFGENAQGKTTLLEAILFTATTKSHRTASETELVRYGEDQFHIHIDAMRKSGPVVLEANWWRGEKRFKVDGIAQTRLSDLLGRVHVVFFSPDDLALIKGAASVRRRFLDMEISQVNPPYLAALQRYRQILRQRNELLRAPTPDPALLDVWDQQLADQGALLMECRRIYIEDLSREAGRVYGAIAGEEPLSITYDPDIRPPASILDTLARHRATDLRQRITSHGPHRDDLEILIAGKPARAFGSQGQQKTAALAVRLAEMALVRDRTGEYPILMLDEVLAELDPQRTHRLFATLPEGVQALITTTQPGGLLQELVPQAARFRIHGGMLESQ